MEEERLWEEGEGTGQGGEAGHCSPRAQKTRALLESDADTFKTSLWLWKSSSGPPQLSTIGDRSCRSGENSLLEIAFPHWQDPLSSNFSGHSPSSDTS
jgi:hypothetical protein